jgi:hypothetical protein
MNGILLNLVGLIRVFVQISTKCNLQEYELFTPRTFSSYDLLRRVTVPGTELCVMPTSLACVQKENRRMYYVNQRLSTQELRQRATKYCRQEIMFVVWTLHASMPASLPTPPVPLPFISNGSEMHVFAPTAVQSGSRWTIYHRASVVDANWGFERKINACASVIIGN